MLASGTGVYHERSYLNAINRRVNGLFVISLCAKLKGRQHIYLGNFTRLEQHDSFQTATLSLVG